MANTALFRSTAPRYMRQLIADFEFSVEDAAAIMGNAGHESAGFTLMQEVQPRGGRGGLGPFQWTGPRRVAYEAWCKRKGWAPSSFEAAYSFLWRELNGDEKGAVAATKKAAGLLGKVQAFEQHFERAAADAKHYESRLSWAQIALQAYKAAAAPAQGVPVPQSAILATIDANARPAPSAPPAEPPSIPWYKSQVLWGVIISAVFKGAALVFPKFSWTDDQTTHLVEIVSFAASFLGDAIVAHGRISATAQPVTMTDKNPSEADQLRARIAELEQAHAAA